MGLLPLGGIIALLLRCAYLTRISPPGLRGRLAEARSFCINARTRDGFVAFSRTIQIRSG